MGKEFDLEDDIGFSPDTEYCPECKSQDIQVIDKIFNHEAERWEDRFVCWKCQHDWHAIAD